MTRTIVITTAVLWGSLTAPTVAQTSSLGAQKRKAEAGKVIPKAPREAPHVERNPVYEEYAWIGERPRLPKTFRPNDLITIIVREQRKFEADADLETKKQFDINSELDAFFKPTTGGLGAATFHRGKPNVSYKYDHKTKNEGDTNREDKLTTRLTARIIDVKPNGQLVLEARGRVEHDDEISVITLTGVCRKEDVTADNTILSTLIAEKNVVVKNEGALRAASRRGWIPQLLDALRPF